jgi:hypothetical protein
MDQYMRNAMLSLINKAADHLERQQGLFLRAFMTLRTSSVEKGSTKAKMILHKLQLFNIKICFVDNFCISIIL